MKMIIEQSSTIMESTGNVKEIPFEEGVPTPEKAKKLNDWFSANNDQYTFVRLYHGTGKDVPVLGKGLLPTSATRRRSYQSTIGYVYLAVTPERAKTFGDMGNQSRSIVYEVEVPIYRLLPDID